MLKVDRPKTLKENALISLRDAITEGVFKPGERLVERNLCSSMGVSRTVVRECIRHLESEWLITSNSKGFVVATIERKDVAEIYRIRSMLECAAIRDCALKPDTQTIRELRRLSQSITRCLQDDDVLQALKFTTEFYHTIFSTVGHDVSWTLVERLNGRISRLRSLTLSYNERKTQGPKNLSSIVDAIEQNDAKLAEEICARHLDEAAKIALHLI